MADNTSSTLGALWKEIYSDDINNVIPESAILGKMIPFRESEKVGDKFVMPVQLSHEQGFTYLGTNAAVSTLLAAEAAVYAESQIDPSSTILRSVISYNAADKMTSSKVAFVNWSEMLVKNMVASHAKRNEIAYLYGQRGIGTISAVSNSSGTNTVTLSDFCEAIWGGMEGATLDVFQSNLTSKRNSNAKVTVTAVSLENSTLTLVGNSTDTASFAAGDVLFFEGANAGSGTYKEMAGIDRIVTNTGSLFNISASTYGLWRGVTHSAGSAALTLGKIFSGVAKTQARGMSGDYVVLVHPRTYANLNSDQSALRSYDSSYRYSKNDSGSSELCFYSGSGKIMVKEHLYVKPVEAFGVPVKEMLRIGTTDISFKLPHAAAGGDIFLHIPDKSGYEVRNRSELALFCQKPAHMVKFTNIVNAS
jgi:hypothetical protein